MDSENVNFIIKKIPNPFRKEREYHHGEVRRRQGLINLFKMLGKVDAVVSTFFGPGGEEFFRKHGILTFKFKPHTRIDEALKYIREKYVVTAER